MTKPEMLNILKLLSAMESWAYSEGKKLPDFLAERLVLAINDMTKRILE